MVLYQHIGLRGHNHLTGLKTGESKAEFIPEKWRDEYAPFPGTILAEGTIATGDAGRASNGSQYIMLLSAPCTFRTAYSGRLYGGPSGHIWRWDGQSLSRVA